MVFDGCSGTHGVSVWITRHDLMNFQSFNFFFCFVYNLHQRWTQFFIFFLYYLSCCFIYKTNIHFDLEKIKLMSL